MTLYACTFSCSDQSLGSVVAFLVAVPSADVVGNGDAGTQVRGRLCEAAGFVRQLLDLCVIACLNRKD